jgi:hypothetical protein
VELVWNPLVERGMPLSRPVLSRPVLAGSMPVPVRPVRPLLVGTGPRRVLARATRRGSLHSAETICAKTIGICSQHRREPLDLSCHGAGPGASRRGPARDRHARLEEGNGVAPQGGMGGHQLREGDQALQ